MWELRFKPQLINFGFNFELKQSSLKVKYNPYSDDDSRSMVKIELGQKKAEQELDLYTNSI